MKPHIIFASLALLIWSAPALAQQSSGASSSSSWGVVGSLVPKWDLPPRLEVLGALHFSEDDAEIGKLDLRGNEFRIGVARGRMLAGDWGVSFVRKTIVDQDLTGEVSPGCSGGGGSGGIVLQCTDDWTNFSRRQVRLNGVEVHKFIPFVTISRRAQVGLNIAGGFANASGRIDTVSFRKNYRCTFPAGVIPSFSDPLNLCSGATVSNVAVVQTGAASEDVSRLLKSESSKRLPLGKVEIAGAAIVTPHLKVRVAGGLNYPGTNVFSITGVYLLGKN